MPRREVLPKRAVQDHPRDSGLGGGDGGEEPELLPVEMTPPFDGHR